MLYLVATPIGNLSDISYRAVETLKFCDLILCEDTRHSATLLHHYSIHRPLKSYHKFNEASRLDEIVADLKAGKNIALISDAGTPGIADPGALLVKRCIEQDIAVTAVPGACAAIHALSCSGLSTERFQFYGFLPRKEGEIKRALHEILAYSGTTICYESAKRLQDLLALIDKIEPSRRLMIARELTKKFEEIVRGSARELLEQLAAHEVKGEIVLLFDGAPQERQSDWEQLSAAEHVAKLQESYSITKQEAIKLAAQLREVPKRQLYKELLDP